MPDFVLSREAALDLEDIWEYIAIDSVSAADGLIDKLFNAFSLLAQSPGIGHLRRDLTAHSILYWSVGGYLIIYRALPEQIEIISVTEGSRDIPRFISSRFTT